MAQAIIHRVHQPEYTGENRCLPCTIGNLTLAAAGSILIGTVSPIVALAIAIASITLIYIRGYLIPGTPTMTKRYFPDSVLRWFDKAPRAEIDITLDAETQLLELGAIEIQNDDLAVTDAFASEWTAEIERVQARPEMHLATILDKTLDELEIYEQKEMCLVMENDEEIARWPSQEALLADLAAIPLLRNRAENWANLSQVAQGQLLSGLRIFLEECPTCAGPLAFSEETVESCCRIASVVTYDCVECEARLVEVQS